MKIQIDLLTSLRVDLNFGQDQVVLWTIFLLAYLKGQTDVVKISSDQAYKLHSCWLHELPIQYLIAEAAEIGFHYGRSIRTPFHYACKNGRLDFNIEFNVMDETPITRFLYNLG